MKAKTKHQKSRNDSNHGKDSHSQKKDDRKERINEELMKLLKSANLTENSLRKMVRSHKNFNKRHRLISQMRKKHAKGHRINERQQKDLIKSSIKAEAEFKNSMTESLEVFTQNKPLVRGMEKTILENFDEIRIQTNPIFFPEEVRKTLTDMGYTMKELRYYHNLVFNQQNAQAFKEVLENYGMEKLFDRAAKIHKDVSVPESIDDLRKEGVISITGAEKAVKKTVAAVTVGIGVAIAVVGAVVAIVNPPLGFAIVTGGTLIAAAGAALWEDAEGNDVYIEVGAETSFSYQAVDYPVSAQVIGSSPTGSVTQYPTGNYQGEYYANTSYSKMEIHRTHCGFLHLIKPEHISVYNSLSKAHADGFDNCYYCIGGSER